MFVLWNVTLREDSKNLTWVNMESMMLIAFRLSREIVLIELNNSSGESDLFL